MDEQDMAKTLSELPTRGADDYVTKVIEVYQGVMRVYEPTEATYRAALEAGSESSGVSTSANW